MSEPRNEKQLVDAITTAIQKRWPQAWWLKVHGGGYQRVGVPDLMLCVGGQLIALEVKHRKPGESLEHMLDRVSTVQHNEIRKLRDAGARAEVVWGVEQALGIIEGTLASRLGTLR